jgi:hypothetical protein
MHGDFILGLFMLLCLFFPLSGAIHHCLSLRWFRLPKVRPCCSPCRTGWPLAESFGYLKRDGLAVMTCRAKTYSPLAGLFKWVVPTAGLFWGGSALGALGTGRESGRSFDATSRMVWSERGPPSGAGGTMDSSSSAISASNVSRLIDGNIAATHPRRRRQGAP